MSRQSYLESPTRPALAPTALHMHMAGIWTQWAFHRVKEHPNQSLDEEVMTVRSWRPCMSQSGQADLRPS